MKIDRILLDYKSDTTIVTYIIIEPIIINKKNYDYLVYSKNGISQNTIVIDLMKHDMLPCYYMSSDSETVQYYLLPKNKEERDEFQMMVRLKYL